MPQLIFATRPSVLARWQTAWVMRALEASFPGLVCVEKVIATQGDTNLSQPLPEIGGKGLFTSELEEELLAGSVHCAVHSLKDLPVESKPGLTLGCIPARGEVRDVLVSARGLTLCSLPPGSVVGTSSLRRGAQLLAQRPDLTVRSLRGNVDTRLRKALDGEYDAILLAGAGLARLGLETNVTEWLDLALMLPAPGQGALAVQCRADNVETLSLLSALENPATRQAVTAEREFLLGLGGGCSLPVAAYAVCDPEIRLAGRVATPDGKQVLDLSGSGQDAVEVGRQLALEAIRRGAAELLRPLPIEPKPL